MLHALLNCRDKWLRPGGFIVPDVARLYICGFSSNDIKVWFQPNILYGVDLSNLATVARNQIHQERLSGKDVVTNVHKLISFDLNHMTAADAKMKTNFSLTVYRKANIHGFAFFFDVAATAGDVSKWLSTSPYESNTHWAQSIVLLLETLHLPMGTVIEGTSFTLEASKEVSTYSTVITIDVQVLGRKFSNMTFVS